MRIKKFTAPNMQEAVKQVRKEMGTDAVILSTKSIVNGKGIRGVFSRPAVEITAATDTYPVKPVRMSRSLPGIGQPKKPVEQTSVIQKEIMELKKMVFSLSSDAQHDRVVPMASLSIPEWNNSNSFSLSFLRNEDKRKKNGGQDTLMKLYKIMICNGLDEQFAFQITREVSARSEGKNGEDDRNLRDVLVDMGERFMPVGGSITTHDNRTKVVACLGPTGVGKTTTIAKLAAECAIKKKMNVGLITIDTYRISAVEQLKAYAQILGIPVTVVFSKNELQAALDKYAQKDMVFIDTAGRSYKNKVHMDELVDFFDRAFPIHKYLVLSSVTGNKAMIETTREFMRISPDSLIVSKIDEGTSFGHLLNSSLSFNLPLSYLTSGQVVPDDIELATCRRLVDLVFGN